MVKNDLAKLKKHFEKNIASKSIIYFIGFLAFSILLSCIRQSIQDAANNPQIKIVALIVLTYLAFKSEVIARNEQIAARAFANSSEKENFQNEISEKLSSATLHRLEAMGYMWGIAFTFSNQIEDLYLFLGKFLNISFQITNPYTDWLSLSLTSFLSFVITLYQITLSSVLEIMPFLFIFTILNIIFQFSAEKFVDFHKSEEHINHVLDEINNLTKEK